MFIFVLCGFVAFFCYFFGVFAYSMKIASVVSIFKYLGKESVSGNGSRRI